MAHQQQSKTISVRIYQIDDRIMVAAPMPGSESEDIAVTIVGTHVTIRGEERGPGQHERDLILAEWTVGPYYRKPVLPQPVNGALTNAT
jgi:HSP20 family protein